MPYPSIPSDLAALALFLDIDGTLLDLAPTPREVHVSHELRETLAQLLAQTRGAVAFVSGRPLAELDLLFAPLRLPAGSGHGAEVPRQARAVPRVQAKALDPTVKQLFASIAELAPGILIEDKGYSLALHYRLAPQLEAVVQQKAAEIRATIPAESIELLPGKLVLEIKQGG